MASAGYNDWVGAGKPYTLARPAKAVQATLRSHGLTVYDYPDDGHLKATKPEDHTPYSVTGWPGRNARWVARALDVMPRTDKNGRVTAAAVKENADIARQLIRDRDAGMPGAMWIKYINWTNEDGDCWQERWTSGGNTRTTSRSGDKGHVHISGRSDIDTDTRADGYDPVARMTGGASMAGTTFDSIHNPPWGDGDPRSLARLLWEVFDLDHYKAREIAAKFPGSLPAMIVGLEVAIAMQGGADATRDAANTAAIKVLADVIKAGGGSVDTVAIVNAVTQEAEKTRTLIKQVQAENLDLRAKLAAALTVNATGAANPA